MVKIIPQEDWEIVKKYIKGGEYNSGVVLIPEDIFEEIKRKDCRVEEVIERINEGSWGNYDFGGDADLWADVVLDENHCFLNYVKELIDIKNRKENNYA